MPKIHIPIIRGKQTDSQVGIEVAGCILWFTGAPQAAAEDYK